MKTDVPMQSSTFIIIVMYIYYVFTNGNALSTQMIHVNQNIISYTHVEHSPTNAIYIKIYEAKTKLGEFRPFIHI